MNESANVLSQASINHLISTLAISPIQPFFDTGKLSDRDDELKVSFSLGDAFKLSGVPVERRSDTVKMAIYPKFRADFDPAARSVMAHHSAIYGNQGNLAQNYELAIASNGEVGLRLWRILSRIRILAVMSETDMQRLSAKAGELIAKRDADRQLSESRGEITKFAQISTRGSVLEQLGCLKAYGQRITLPEFTLSHYSEIKKQLLRAGAVYGSNVTGSYFDLPLGIDAHATLNQLQAGIPIHVKKETQFFATPLETAQQAIATLGDLRGKRVLEPSAGTGALADLARAAGAEVLVVENWMPNVLALKEKGYSVHEHDFLSLGQAELGSFDFVIMNPPFSGQQDLAHVKHALSFLKADGQITAIVSSQFKNSSTKESLNFRDLMALSEADVRPLGQGAFKESGTNASTELIHLKMENLTRGLKDSNQTDASFGLDLSLALEGTCLRPKQATISQARPRSLRP